MSLADLLEHERRVWDGEVLGASIPALAGCAPESQVCVARILHGLHLLGEDVVLPAWRSMRLDVEVRLAFTALELAMQPEASRGDTSPLAIEALLRTRARDVRPGDFEALVELCLSKEELRFHQHALALLDEQAGRVDPGSLAPLFEALLDTALAPLAVERLVAVGGTVPAYAALQGHHRSWAAIHAHGMQGDRILLLRLAADPSLAEELRLTALAVLGRCARREDLDTLIAIALRDPARSATAGIAALVELRHRGIFLQATHLDAVFELARFAPTPLASLTAHLPTERRELLEGIDPEDSRWLVWLLAFDRPGHGLTTVLSRLLDSETHGIRAMALDLLKHPPCDGDPAKPYGPPKSRMRHSMTPRDHGRLSPTLAHARQARG
ncbi:MAG: hypothetical protein KC656_12605, partial [Myxococcales bacterium]|nr:hypothetical protein [Myxococcales bacterium]